MFNRQRFRRHLEGSSKGFTLIEVIIAMVILGVVGAAVLMALGVAGHALFIADEQATARSLAASQMEYVMRQAYSRAPPGGEGNYTVITGIPIGYSIWSVNRAGLVVEGVIGVPWDPSTRTPVSHDAGLQRVKLIVRHHGQNVIALEGFKVNR
jgi:prepilin-type N-terminal cleavage/methylation domain-containing protein